MTDPSFYTARGVSLSASSLGVPPARAFGRRLPVARRMPAACSFLGLFVARESPIASPRWWPARFCLA
jgi:hypothetical protein